MEKVYHKPTSSIVDLTIELKKEIKQKGSINEYAKILALPEHFSLEQLQMIVDGKLKHGDKVLVECEGTCSNCGTIHENSILCSSIDGFDYKVEPYQIKLNPHITIYPAEKQKCTNKFCQMDDFGGCSCKEEKMYTRLEVKIILHKFNNPQSNEDVFRVNTWFEQNVK